jgi:hypothetical protein
MKSLMLVALVAATLVVVVLLAGIGRPPEQARGADPPTGRTITVVGTGTVKSVPDEAQFSLGVETRADNARDAVSANATAMHRLLDALRASGVDRSDLQTQSVSVWPRSEDGNAVAGYTASNSVSATVAVAKAGDLVDAASAAGANQIWGPQLSRSDQEALHRQAYDTAVANARANARALADAAGVSIGRVVRIVEAGAQPEPMYERAALASADAATPVEPGRVGTAASVTATFEIA